MSAIGHLRDGDSYIASLATTNDAAIDTLEASDIVTVAVVPLQVPRW